MGSEEGLSSPFSMLKSKAWTGLRKSAVMSAWDWGVAFFVVWVVLATLAVDLFVDLVVLTVLTLILVGWDFGLAAEETLAADF